MCGIVGARHDWLATRGRDPAAAMAAAVAALRWRGPDGAGVVRAGGWWLGCARLAITEPRSRQPVVGRGGRYAAVLNGAITNARDLWRELRPRAARREPPPNDAWLPLLAVAQGRADLLAALRGHHAYAVVDTATDQLVYGQDRFGEKPLVLFTTRDRGAAPQLAAFASLPIALQPFGLPLPAVDRRLAALCRRGFVDLLPHRTGPRQWLRPVAERGVPLAAAAGGAWAAPWRPASRAPAPPAAVAPSLAGPVALRDRALAAVARCADTAVPAGLALSGGIDSSCLAACLAALGRRLPAYQFCAAGASTAERDVAAAVAARCGLPFRPVGGGPELLAALPELTRLAGIPLADPSVLALHALARAAAGDGVRVLLGGEGADELFLGYRRYRAVATLPHLPLPAWLLPRWSMRYPARWLRATAAADPYAELLAIAPPGLLAEGLAEGFAWRGASLPQLPIPQAVAQHLPSATAARVAAARRTDLGHYLRTDLLPKVDVATLAAGVEARCPWLEGDFGAAATSAAPGKQVLRDAFAKDLPAKVFRQPKRGFAIPVDRWLRTPGPLLDLLAEPRSRQRPHLRPGGLARAVDRHQRGGRLGHALFALAALECYLRLRD